MAVRRPLYWTGDGLRPMSDAMIDTIVNRAVWQWASDPSVTLSRIAASGNLDAMTDTRFQAGDATVRKDRFATEAETPDIEQVDVTYDHINQSVATGTAYPADTSNRSFPVYLSGTDVRPMTQTDFVDTFIKPAIDLLVSNSSANSLRAGTYAVLPDSIAGGVPSYLEAVSANPIFVNTIADVDLFSASGIPEAKDQPETIETYKLYKYKNATSAPAISQRPLVVTSDANLQQFSDASLDTLLKDSMRHATAGDATTGYRIRYEISTAAAGTNRGMMVDTRLNGSSADGYTRDSIADAYYRTQEFPNGIEAVVNTYYLKISLT